MRISIEIDMFDRSYEFRREADETNMPQRNEETARQLLSILTAEAREVLNG